MSKWWQSPDITLAWLEYRNPLVDCRGKLFTHCLAPSLHPFTQGCVIWFSLLLCLSDYFTWPHSEIKPGIIWSDCLCTLQLKEKMCSMFVGFSLGHAIEICVWRRAANFTCKYLHMSGKHIKSGDVYMTYTGRKAL
jgi:hypothetical protein